VAERTEFETALAQELGLEPRVETDRILEQALTAFFSQHYRQKTDIQCKAVSPIYLGKNALVVSATASGKTEAAVCPVSARILSQKENALCLYVAPTKALLND
jgi:ATP-dependent Lhr-like helicase